MENTNKAFYTEIVRGEIQPKNNLYELLNVVPATPLQLKDSTQSYTCDFVPKTDKVFIPKRRPRAKVKTVRDVRALFESDTYSYLTKDLEHQKNYVLKKIRGGFSKNEKTIEIAKKMLQADFPISRSTWQMLININPNNYQNNRQFVLWNGKLIQVNGSIGGKYKLICNYDLEHARLSSRINKILIRNNNSTKRKGLLRNSLAIKFKPGPLGKKKFLDDSHQKYNGDIELVDLPRVGLEIQPTYGTRLEPTIMSFLGDLQGVDGTMSEKWAEFAVSVLGRMEKTSAKLLNREYMTFDLNYRCAQRRILMRKDVEALCITEKKPLPINEYLTKDQQTTQSEIKYMMSKILDAVEINIKQDDMFTPEDDLHEATSNDLITCIDLTQPKEKTKKKYCELGRLDVTVIQLPDSMKKESKVACRNLYCTLGCVCDSLKQSCNFRPHCGRPECMFECTCDFSKYININSLDVNDTSLIPAIIGIEDEINKKLAKEEQKFHQTVIVTGERNILFKTERRKGNLSKKYESVYENIYPTNNKRKRVLSVTTVKINFENVEPWCLVHNLYKCFCKGKFTDNITNNTPSIQNIIEDSSFKVETGNVDCSTDEVQKLTNTTIPDIKCLTPQMTPVADKTSDNSDVTSKKMNVSDTTENIESSFKKNEKSTDTTIPNKIGLRPRVRPNRYIGDKTSKTNPVADKTSVNRNIPSRKIHVSGCDSNKKQKSDMIDTVNRDRNKISRSKSKLSSIYPDESNETRSLSESSDPYDFYLSDYNGTCARVTGYEGRKYSNGHYNNINYKIKELEKNDKNLHIKMLKILNADLVAENTDNNEKEIISTKHTAIENSQSKEEANKSEQVQLECQKAESSDPNFMKFFYDIDCLRSGDDGDSKRNFLPRENKLVAWLESNYKLYKKRIDKGLLKTSLEPPKAGKLALYSWDFILGRYRDRKNLFLISKEKPYRIFMGVNTRAPFFQTCMNIDEIRFADLYRYPQTVKNLLTNASDLKDNFCILRGSAHCWELVGSVAKINKDNENMVQINDETSDSEPNCQSNLNEESSEQLSFGTPEKEDMQNSLKEQESKSECADEADSSKWFIMTVENDFSEIRFYKKGFFVKYESIVKAINVARISGKTVRLSSQKCVDKNNGPQFGVYAIPNSSEHCVFIGPYEIRDSLGIETIKTILDVRKINRTRGFWITTNKIDNLKVIDNPMSFMPLTSFENNEAIPLENHFSDDKNSHSLESPGKSNLEELDKTPTKSLVIVKPNKKVKPIKIKKLESYFYQVTSDGSLKNSLQSSSNILTYSPVSNQNSHVGTDAIFNSSFINIPHDNNAPNIKKYMSKDITAEDIPQLKITAVYSQKKSISKPEMKVERGMSILKPEEINRRLIEKQNSIETSMAQDIIYNIDDNISKTESIDINSETSVRLPTSTTDGDVYVISDDESGTAGEVDGSKDHWEDVLIQCTNVTDQAWILGRQISESRLLSFKVPGGEYSEFYPELDAFQQLNKELSGIVDSSCRFNLEWKVVDLTEEIKSELSDMDLVFWRKVLLKKVEQTSQNAVFSSFLTNKTIKTYSRKTIVSTSGASPITVSDGEVLPDMVNAKDKEEETVMEIEEISE